MTKNNLYLILVLIFLFFSCKKQHIVPVAPPLLPPATQTGANVVAWLTDSIPYIAKNGYALGTVQIDTASYGVLKNTGSFTIQTSLIDNKGYERGLLLNLPANTPFPIADGANFPMSPYSLNGLFESLDPNGAQLVFGAFNGQILITHFNLSKKIISGTFSFASIKNTAGQSRTIDGWFDLTFTLYYF